MVFVQNDSKQNAIASVPDSYPGQLDERRRERAAGGTKDHFSGPGIGPSEAGAMGRGYT